MPVTLSDIRRIFKVLGQRGAVAGLQASDMPYASLMDLCEKAKIAIPPESSRDELINALVTSFRKVELKPIAELLLMTYDELVQHFAQAAASNNQLIQIMTDLNYKVGAQDMKRLRRFVARQISETSLFSTVASGSRDSERIRPRHVAKATRN